MIAPYAALQPRCNRAATSPNVAGGMLAGPNPTPSKGVCAALFTQFTPFPLPAWRCIPSAQTPRAHSWSDPQLYGLFSWQIRQAAISEQQSLSIGTRWVCWSKGAAGLGPSDQSKLAAEDHLLSSLYIQPSLHPTGNARAHSNRWRLPGKTRCSLPVSTEHSRGSHPTPSAVLPFSLPPKSQQFSLVQFPPALCLVPRDFEVVLGNVRTAGMLTPRRESQ